MNTERLRHLTSRALLTIAYMAIVFEWLWLAIVGLPLLIETGLFDTMATDTRPIVQAPVERQESSPIVVAVVGVATVVILAVTTVILFKLPRTILKGGETVVTQATARTLPIITHHKQLPAKKRRELSRRLRLIIELTACLIPIIALLFLPAPKELTSWMVITVAGFLGSLAFIAFLIAWLIEPSKSTSRTRSRASRG